ncbi:MAG: hypothetical protein JNM31_01175 [Flavobacteriales bacterium]|nr:hypothetical protein [Flavobacteriales bacterium]
MFRTLTALAFSALTTFVAAQDRTADTPEMLATATERTAVVDRTVSLNATQKEEVNAMYVEVERYMAAIRQRYAGQPQEVIDGDMPLQYANMDRYVTDRLATILTPEQYSRWQEANK